VKVSRGLVDGERQGSWASNIKMAHSPITHPSHLMKREENELEEGIPMRGRESLRRRQLVIVISAECSNLVAPRGKTKVIPERREESLLDEKKVGKRYEKV